MKLEKRNYTVSIKGSRDYQSVSVTEGFESTVDDTFNEIEYTQEKEQLKERVIEETKKLLTSFIDGKKIEEDIKIDIELDDDEEINLEEDY